MLKLFYWKDSSFLTPQSYWNNWYIWPIDNKIKLNFNELVKFSEESLLKSWYDEIWILWESKIVFNSWTELNSQNCDIWICNIKK